MKKKEKRLESLTIDTLSSIYLLIWITLEIQIILQKINKLLMWWLIIGKWKSDINGRSRQNQ